MAKALRGLVGDGTTLIVLPAADEQVERSIRNLAQAKILRAQYLNIRDILGFDRLLLPLGSLEVIQSYLGEGGQR
jgi:large subunit ribosomal protein L4